MFSTTGEMPTMVTFQDTSSTPPEKNTENNAREMTENNAPKDPDDKKDWDEFGQVAQTALAHLANIGITPLYILPETEWAEIRAHLVQIDGFPYYTNSPFTAKIPAKVRRDAYTTLMWKYRIFHTLMFALLCATAVWNTPIAMAFVAFCWAGTAGTFFLCQKSIMRAELHRSLKTWVVKKSDGEIIHELAREPVQKDGVVYPVLVNIPHPSPDTLKRKNILEQNGIVANVDAAPRAVHFETGFRLNDGLGLVLFMGGKWVLKTNIVGLLIEECEKTEDGLSCQLLRVARMTDEERAIWKNECPVMWCSVDGTVAIIDQWGDAPELLEKLEPWRISPALGK